MLKAVGADTVSVRKISWETLFRLRPDLKRSANDNKPPGEPQVHPNYAANMPA
jgi:hypothetical protein